MFWSKQRREDELQRELDGYVAEIEALIENAEANASRAFDECQRLEWNYWRQCQRDLRMIGSKYMDHARGGGDYWVRAVRNLGGYRHAQAYGRHIYRDESGQVRSHPHNEKSGTMWEPDAWYVPDPEPEPQPALAPARPFRVQIQVASEWVDVQSFDDHEAAAAFCNGISDSTTRIAP